MISNPSDLMNGVDLSSTDSHEGLMCAAGTGSGSDRPVSAGTGVWLKLKQLC